MGIMVALLMSGHLRATAQIPDTLIYQGERMALRINPLESYYSKTNPRPKGFFKNPSLSSACWRGYVATWKIDRDHLFLVQIRECHGKRTASLEKFFPTLYQGGRVPASWYSGLLKCPRGKLVKYIHMGYRSEYERELIIEVKNGQVVSTHEFGNFPPHPLRGYKIINLPLVKIMVPETIQPCQGSNSRTENLCFENNDRTLSISGTCKRNSRIIPPFKQPDFVKKIIKKKLDRYKQGYTVINSQAERGRWGYCAWADGYNQTHHAFLRIYVITNRSTTLTLLFATTGLGTAKSKAMADIIFKQVKLRGY
jgi:hypothetical protein